jgi:hypothetical protein
MEKKLLVRNTKNNVPDFNNVLTKCVMLFTLCMFYLISNISAVTCDNYGSGDANNIVYTVNGSVVSSLSGVSSGDHVQVCFNVSNGSSTIFTLVSYSAPSASFSESTASLQTIFDQDSKTFSGSGTCCLSVTVPSCYFQVDFIKGCVISQLGPEGSNNFYGVQGRLIAGVNGGSGICNCVASADASADISLECNQSQVTLSGSTYTHSPVISWQAIDGGHIVLGTNTLSPIVNATGTYVLTVFDTLGCSVTDSVNVTIPPALTVNIGHDTTLCAGTTLMLDAGNHGLGFIWNTGATTQTINVSTAGTYYVSVINGNCTASDTIHVTVIPLPIVDLGNDITVTTCAGPVHLDAGNAGMAYLWSTGATTQTISVSASGTYYVNVMNSNNCMASDTIHVTVNPVSIHVDLGNDILLCVGQSMMLDAGNAGLSFMWNTGATTQTINVTTAGTYYVSVTNGTCTSSDTIHVISIPLPVVNLGSDINITTCGGPVQLDAGNAGMAYLWNTGAITQTISVTTSGTYYVSVMNSNNCIGTDTIDVTINPVAIHVDLGNDTILCAGESLMLNAGNIGLDFIWSTGATTQMINVTTSGMYSVSVINGNCTALDSIHVTVVPLPVVDLGSDITITTCAGPVHLDAGNPGMSYLWSTGATTQTISVSTSGTYYVNVMNSNNCMASDTIHVTVNPVSIHVDLGNDTILCAGSSLMLNAGNTGLDFMWSTGATTQTINITTSGTYYVSVINGNCVVTDSIHVTVLPPMQVDLGSDTTVVLCSGTIALNAGNNGMTYAWSTGAITQTIHVSESGTYYVTAMNGIGCIASDTIHVTINPGSLSINLGSDTTIMTCHHENLMLDAGVTGATYIWNTGAITQTITATVSGTYYVNVLDNRGCIASDTLTVTIIDNTIDLNLGADTTVCSCIQLTAGTGGTTYNWCNGADYHVLNVCSTGVYCVTVNNGMCMAADTISITVNPPPVVHLGNDTTFISGMIALNAGNTGATYLWSTGATTQTINVISTGTYYVTITNTSGCTASDSIHVNIGTMGVTESVATNFILDVYPNPTDGKINIDLGNLGESVAVLKISNLLGEVVFTETITPSKQNTTKTLDMKGNEAGIYFFTIQTEKGLMSKKIILQ